MKLKTNLGLLGMTLTLLATASCIEHQKKDKSKPVSRFESTKSMANEKSSANYKTIRIYNGTIPCADCGGIQQRLVLKGDTAGVYRLSETYLNATEDGDSYLVSTGEWKLTKAKKNTEQTLWISQGHLGDSMRVAQYKFSDKKLVQTSLDEEPIKNNWSYVLKRKSK